MYSGAVVLPQAGQRDRGLVALTNGVNPNAKERILWPTWSAIWLRRDPHGPRPSNAREPSETKKFHDWA